MAKRKDFPERGAAIDRRAFITGRIVDADAIVAPPETEIASILVQTRPERLDEVAAAIAVMEGCEIHGRDPRGKLVVVVESTDASKIGSALNCIAVTPNVITASLVFHAIEPA